MTQLEEFETAIREGRQPTCAACGQPLDAVSQLQDDLIRWAWDAEDKRYYKEEFPGEFEAPMHEGCDAEEWELVASGEVAVKLGLVY